LNAQFSASDEMLHWIVTSLDSRTSASSVPGMPSPTVEMFSSTAQLTERWSRTTLRPPSPTVMPS
jgi:hypothetical protein